MLDEEDGLRLSNKYELLEGELGVVVEVHAEGVFEDVVQAGLAFLF